MSHLIGPLPSREMQVLPPSATHQAQTGCGWKAVWCHDVQCVYGARGHLPCCCVTGKCKLHRNLDDPRNTLRRSVLYGEDWRPVVIISAVFVKPKCG